jgi:alkylated DNA repair dioxygenase AlkB
MNTDSYRNKYFKMEKIDLPGAEVYYQPQFLHALEADHYYRQLDNLEDWSQRPIILFGRQCQQNRQTLYFGETGVNYRYSGINNPGTGEVPDVLREISAKVEKHLVDQGLLEENEHFNYWLGNRYADGNQNIGMHSDDERGLVGPIVSLSFGASRYFDFRQRISRSDVKDEPQVAKKLRLNLESGSLLLMGGETQKNYLHGVPTQKKIKEPRINITLRFVA